MGKAHLQDIPFLPPGTFNDPEVSVEFLNTLPLRLRRHWRRIDFEKYEKMFAPEAPEEEEKPETPQEPSDDNYLWQVEKKARTEVDVKELSEERKAKVKAIALAELKEQREKDPVQFDIEKELEKIRRAKNNDI